MDQSPHILVVEDDADIRRMVSDFFEQNGYRVTAARDGREAGRILGLNVIDLIILDIMLPHEDGLSLCARIRENSNVPIIMLTALGAEAERVKGLDTGADDYLAKPFNTHELLARARAILRRARELPRSANTRRGSIASFAGWRLDLAARRLESPDGAVVPLTRGELELLTVLCEHPNRVLSRDQLASLTRARAQPPERSVDLQVSRLRRKIETDPKDPLLLQTVRAEGYIFTPEVRIA
jgi:two-component system, OmpR family, response regulator